MSNLKNFGQVRGEPPVYFARQVKVCDSWLLVTFHRDLKDIRSLLFIFKALHMGSNQLTGGDCSILTNQTWSAEERQRSSGTGELSQGWHFQASW